MALETRSQRPEVSSTFTRLVESTLKGTGMLDGGILGSDLATRHSSRSHVEVGCLDTESDGPFSPFFCSDSV